jgi:hypothetical protein
MRTSGLTIDEINIHVKKFLFTFLFTDSKTGFILTHTKGARYDEKGFNWIPYPLYVWVSDALCPRRTRSKK